VIHGESRCGKSHLARRALCDLARGKNRHQITVIAREQLEAQNVMRQVFEKMYELYRTKVSDVHLALDESGKMLVQFTDELVNRVAGLLVDRVESMTISLSQTRTKSLEAGLKASIVPKIFSLLGRYRSQTGEEEGWQITIRQPSPKDCADFVGIMVDTLVRLGLLNHLLLLLDDVDLLEGYAPTEQSGRLERSILTGALCALHREARVDVLITARSWYAHAHKELNPLVDMLGSEEMGVRDLVAIHNNHFSQFSPKGYPRTFLTAEALKEAALDSRGLPGLFLQHLRTAFDQYKREPEWGERDYQWYLNIFVGLYAELRRKAPEGANLTEAAIAEGKYEVDTMQYNPFRHNRFLDELVFQSYHNESTYFFDPLLEKVVKILQGQSNAQDLG
jgi:hypothetical protein